MFGSEVIALHILWILLRESSSVTMVVYHTWNNTQFLEKVVWGKGKGYSCKLGSLS